MIRERDYYAQISDSKYRFFFCTLKTPYRSPTQENPGEASARTHRRDDGERAKDAQERKLPNKTEQNRKEINHEKEYEQEL